MPGEHLGGFGRDVGFAEVGDEGVADGVEVGVEAGVISVGEEVAALAAARSWRSLTLFWRKIEATLTLTTESSQASATGSGHNPRAFSV